MQEGDSSWQDCQAHSMSWASCVASENYCPFSAVSQPAPEWAGSEWGGPGLGLASVLPLVTAGSEQGQCATLTPLWAQPHAGTGKQPELWSGCVMAAPQWCDGHMILLWCLLLKDRRLSYF